MCNPNWTAWGCIGAIYFIQLILISVGLITGIIGLISRDIASILVDQKPFLKIKEFEFNPQMSRKMRLGLQISGATLVAIGMVWIFAKEIQHPAINIQTSVALGTPAATNENPVIPPDVHLLSASFMVDGWEPRMVDLRHAKDDGIPVSAGHSLKFLDLWVVSTSESGYKVSVEVRVDGNSIGETEEQFVDASQPVNLGGIHVTGYEYSTDSEAWHVQSEWKELTIVLNQLVDGQPVVVTETKIKLNPAGKAWLISPPNAALVHISYKINDGLESIINLSDVMNNGIDAKEGDTLSITGAWYKANLSDNTKRIQLEAYLSSGTYDPASLYVSPDIAIREGVNSLGDLSKLNWTTIPADKKSLVLTLARTDRTVLDRYTIPLRSKNTSGLIPLTSAVQWHFSEFAYFDFEQKDDLMGWVPAENMALGTRSEYAFTGSYALAVGTNRSNSQVFATLPTSFQANYIIGQVYWPKTEGISVNWAQVCLGGNVRCVSISQKPGQWNPFFINLQEMQDDDGIPYSDKEIPSLFFQGDLIGVSQENQYLFYIDGIQIYPVKTP